MGRIRVKKAKRDGKTRKEISSGFFHERMEKVQKGWEIMKRGQIMMKRAKVDGK
jgi:hypothetical protein